MNWLIEYYKTWIAYGLTLLGDTGYRILPDGTISYDTAYVMGIFMFSPTGFWITHIAVVVLIAMIWYLIKTKGRAIKGLFEHGK